jgi:hypothetical protein
VKFEEEEEEEEEEKKKIFLYPDLSYFPSSSPT